MRNLLILISFTLLLFSCTDSYTDDLTTKKIYNIHVKASQWAEHTDNAGLNRYYSYHYNIAGAPSTSSSGIMVYIDYGDYQQSLPYTRYYENSNGDRWSRTIDYDFSNHDINFYVTNSDFAIDPPEDMYFRVVYIW